MSKWPMVALGEVASIDRKVIPPDQLKDGTIYLGLEHIERGGRIKDIEIIGEFSVASAKHAFTREHILYGKLRPNLGKISRPEFSGICSTDILPIRVGGQLNRSFLFHYLSQDRLIDHAASRASGANLPRLSPTELIKFPIPLPPLDEQSRIAAILDRASTLRTLKARAVAILEKLKRSAFHKSVPTATLRHSELGDLAVVSSGITKGRKTTLPTQEVPYLTVANVQNGFLNLTTVKTIDATAAEIEKYRLQGGDLVLTEGGDPDKLGRGTVWNDELPLCIHQNHIFRVRVNNPSEMHPLFLANYISSPEARKYFLRSAKQTTGIASINMTQLKALPVPIAPASLQESFLRQAVSIDTRLDRAMTSFRTIDDLFVSLQSRAFRGEL